MTRARCPFRCLDAAPHRERYRRGIHRTLTLTGRDPRGFRDFDRRCRSRRLRGDGSFDDPLRKVSLRRVRSHTLDEKLLHGSTAESDDRDRQQRRREYVRKLGMSLLGCEAPERVQQLRRQSQRRRVDLVVGRVVEIGIGRAGPRFRFRRLSRRGSARHFGRPRRGRRGRRAGGRPGGGGTERGLRLPRREGWRR